MGDYLGKGCIVYVVLSFLFCIIYFSYESCSEEDSEQRLTEFHQACEKEDFVEAYKLLAEIKEKNGSSEYEKCKFEVVNREALYLVTQNDEQSAQRIIVLLAQYFADDEKSKKKIINNSYKIAVSLKNEYVLNVLEEVINGPKITPVKTSISGPLNAYFEVVERDYRMTKADEVGDGNLVNITINFKRLNKKGDVSHMIMIIRLMDKNENIICSDQKSLFLSSISKLGVGEIGSISFQTVINEKISSFVVESSD